MLKEKKMMLFVSAVILFTAMAFSDLTTTGTVILPSYSDVSVVAVYGDNCFCDADISSVGLLFQQNVWVKIANEKCPSGLPKKKVSGKVIVEYYDHAGKRDVKVEKPFTDMLNDQAIKVITGKVLTKSIKASVVLSGTVKDCNAANNSKTITQCQLAPLI